MLTGSRLERMLGVLRRAALPVEARTGEAMLGGEAVLRRLAAIGVAARYSPLIEAGEVETLARPRSPGHDPSDPKIALHKERTLKTTGDGMLIEFAYTVGSAPIPAG